MEGLDEIRRTVEQAEDRIEVLPGGGIRAENLAQVLATGVEQVHLSLSEQRPDPSAKANPAVYFGADLPTSEATYRAVSEERVRVTRSELDRLRG